jgi:outer membrane lipoprotein LolB
MRPLRRHAWPVAALLTLAGCATPPGPATTSALETATSVRTCQGRFSVRYDDQNGTPRNAYGNFAWREAGDAVTLELRNPFGQTLALVDAGRDGARLALPGKPTRQASDVDSLMRDALGFALPVASLRYWLRPQADPASPARVDRAPDSDRPTHIEQNGWTIDYVAYTEGPAPVVRRMDLAREAPPLGIKLVIDR